MSTHAPAHFEGGRNIAMKVPPHLFDATLKFYRDTLNLPTLEESPTGAVFSFGPARLWLDRVEHATQAEVWLEIIAPDLEVAATHLESKGVVRRDSVERLPEGFGGFWICNPANLIHLVARSGES